MSRGGRSANPEAMGNAVGNAYLDVLRHYIPLGFTSFGGPSVHVIILRRKFVEHLHWVDLKTFLDLFALGNALPGPGSTQLAFSIAVVHYGVLPGLLAFLCWSLPGALGMAGLGIGVSRIPEQLPGIVLAFLTGLNAAAVGLIALAAYQLSQAAGTDQISTVLIWLSAGFGICYHAPWMYPVLIVAGGLATLVWDFRRQWTRWVARIWGGGRKRGLNGGSDATDGESSYEMARQHPPQNGTALAVEDPQPRQRSSGNTLDDAVISRDASSASNALQVVSPRIAICLLAAFALLLIVPLAVRGGLARHGRDVPRALDLFANMLVAGTIIFGGGPVVIPLLRDYVVVPGWVSSRDFLLTFAILQAFPGPNFNFSVALGILALQGSPTSPALGASIGYLGIFSPGIILKLGLLPLYASWRDKAAARAVIRGLNASASGLVWTAVWQLFLVGHIYQGATGPEPGQTLSGPLTADPFWAVVASGAFVGCRTFSLPPWASIVLGGVAGLGWYGVQRS